MNCRENVLGPAGMRIFSARMACGPGLEAYITQHIQENEQRKLLQRVKKIRGQLDAAERILVSGQDCTDVLMLLAAIRGGVNSLMAEVLEDHLRLHVAGVSGERITPELAEELIELVRSYLK